MEENEEEECQRAPDEHTTAHAPSSDLVREMLRSEVAYPAIDWPVDHLVTGHTLWMQPVIAKEHIDYRPQMEAQSAIIQPADSEIVTLVVSEHMNTFWLLRETEGHTASCNEELPVLMKQCIGGICIGHILPADSIVHAFAFIQKHSNKLVLSMFDVCCVDGQYITGQTAQGRNLMLRDMIGQAWERRQISAVQTLVARLKQKGGLYATVGFALEKKCVASKWGHLEMGLLDRIAMCQEPIMQQLPAQYWQNVVELQHVRFPLSVADNIHWQPVIPMSDAMKTKERASSYQAAGSPVFQDVLLMPEIDDGQKVLYKVR